MVGEDFESRFRGLKLVVWYKGFLYFGSRVLVNLGHDIVSLWEYSLWARGWEVAGVRILGFSQLCHRLRWKSITKLDVFAFSCGEFSCKGYSNVSRTV